MIFFDNFVRRQIWFDKKLLATSLILLAFGLVMVTSASLALAERNTGDALFYLKRQLTYTVLGIGLASVCYMVSLTKLKAYSKWLILFAMILLFIVLIPVIGKEVNGSRRWIDLGAFSLQVSEFVKLATIIYFANYISRHYDTIAHSMKEFIMPLFVVALIMVLLLLEPDYGAAFVIMLVGLAMMWFARVKFRYFFLISLLLAALMTLLAVVTPYRWERIISFSNPWKDPLDSGYQLIQSLIAVGSGGWFGLGLGDSVQKLFYLPEPHTDFIFSIIAEELGFVGVFAVIFCFGLFLQRCFSIGYRAEQEGLITEAYYAYGIGVWFGVQAFINMSVAVGLLPTKGITLPLISYGGSSLIVSLIAIGLLMRIYHEVCSVSGGSRHYRMARRRYA